MPQLIVTHERLGYWSRQLRPRLAASPICWVETRSAAELTRALARGACPILVLNLADRPRPGLEALGCAAAAVPDMLALVLNPQALPEVVPLAREFGATQVVSGVIPPPVVAAIVGRWLPIAARRAQAAGWAPGIEPVTAEEFRARERG